VLFRTDEVSWHGVPEPLNTPFDTTRNTINYYYVSDLYQTAEEAKKYGGNGKKYGADPETGYRMKAAFIRRPGDAADERLDKLYKIRPHRKITPEDMQELWPEGWKIDMYAGVTDEEEL